MERTRQDEVDPVSVVISEEPTGAKADPHTWEDVGAAVYFDQRKIAVVFAVVAIGATAIGVLAYLVSSGELSGRRPGSRLDN
jgi:hypothetical protein